MRCAGCGAGPHCPRAPASRMDVQGLHRFQNLHGVRFSNSTSIRRQALVSSAPVAGVAPSGDVKVGVQSTDPSSKVLVDEDSGLWGVVSGTTAKAGQYLSQLRLWPPGVKDEAAMVIKGAELVHSKAGMLQDTVSLPPDINRFLNPSSAMEVRNIQKLSSLAALTYFMDILTPRLLEEKHQLDLVTTSMSCERSVYDGCRSAEETVAEGDGMGCAYGSISCSIDDDDDYGDIHKEGSVTEGVPLQSALTSNIVAMPGILKNIESGTKRKQPPPPPPKTAPEIVAAKLSEAAAAAANAAVLPFTTAANSFSESVNFVSQSLQGNTREVGSSVSAAPAIATIAAAEASANPHHTDHRKSSTPSTCPSEWFVCDDQAQHMRYFVIQGSDSIDHWKCNLTFDPMYFEDPKMGIKVHRGAYTAAKALYDRFLPLVREHLDSSANARICFVGHSVGGSMATLLMLMFKARGAVSASNIAPVHTFGAPAVFCEGHGDSLRDATNIAPDLAADDALQRENAETTSTKSLMSLFNPSHGVLRKLGLRAGDVRNVIMHRDIVPRAFTCDYTLVADVLKSWAGFRDLAYLSLPGRKLVYGFIGDMYVLQPTLKDEFARHEPYHPLLPECPGLFKLVSCTLSSRKAALMRRSLALKEGRRLGREVDSVGEAILALMDHPHPLRILSEHGSYLPSGAISRYHNPDNYTAALSSLEEILRSEQDLSLDWGILTHEFGVATCSSGLASAQC